jgi:replicative DNA helicase
VTASRIPPHSVEAEAALLGALILTPVNIPSVAALVRPEDFYKPSHGHLYAALVDLHGHGEPVDVTMVAEALRRAGVLDGIGGAAGIRSIVADCPASSHAAAYAETVATLSHRRRVIGVGAEIVEAGYDLGGEVDSSRLVELVRFVADTDPAVTRRRRGYVPGGAFVLDAPERVPAVWGAGDEVAWASGEPLLLVGPQGVGKTTIAQQLALARIGLLPKVLGWPVQPGAGRVLYIAADRPEQARRSFRRMVCPENRPILDELLVVWRGPLAHELARRPRQLAEMAAEQEADTVVVDSLKDVAVKLTDDEVGATVNRAFQEAVADGIEVAGLHHQRKEQRGAGKPKALADVYGSTWITAGCGSVLLLWGEPGDPVVDLTHLKQPAVEVGPVKVLHDQETGTSSLLERVDAYALLRAASGGLTVIEAATTLYGPQHTPNEREKTRRQLDRLVRTGQALKDPGSRGGGSDRDPSRYYLAAPAEVPA